jgi:hypothetical protein
LSEVLVREFSQFEVNQDEAPQGAMVKDEVDVEMVAFERDAFLAGNEEKVATEFQKKFLQVVDNGLFQVFFLKVFVFFEVEELQDERVFDEVERRVGFGGLAKVGKCGLFFF